MASCNLFIESFPSLLQLVQGPTDREITGLCSPKSPSNNKILFVHEEKFLNESLNTECLTFVVSNKISEQAKKIASNKQTILETPNVRLAKTFIGQMFFPITSNKSPFDGQRIHQTAVISDSANIADDVIVGPNTVIGQGVSIAAGTVIGSNTTIEPNVTIGKNCHIHSQVLIAHDCILKDEVIVQSQSTVGSVGFGYAQNEKGESFATPHYGRTILEDRVEVGAGVNIDRGNLDDTIIGEGTKIDNHCHFAHNFKSGKNCLITAGFITAGSSEIGDLCIFAGRASVNGHIKIGDRVTVGPLGVVTNNLDKPGQYGGFPLIPYKDFLRMQATLAHLPQMRKELKRLVKKADGDS